MSLVDLKPNKDGIPCLSKVDLEQIAVDYISRYNRSLLEQSQPFDIDEFAEEYLGITLDFAELSSNGSILGIIAFSDCTIPAYDRAHDGVRQLTVKAGTAVIDSTVMAEYEYRGRFTIAHECSHWILHRPIHLLYPNQLSLDFDQSTNDASKAIICRQSKSLDTTSGLRHVRDWREWQADYLAGCLLMTPAAVINLVRTVKMKHMNDSLYSFKRSDGSEDDLFRALLIKEMSDNFQVSCLAAEIRLKQLGILTDNQEGQIPLTTLTPQPT